MKPISAWTSTAQDSLEKGTLLFERDCNEFTITAILSDFSLWFVARWPDGGRVAFRAAYGFNGILTLEAQFQTGEQIEFILKGSACSFKVILSFNGKERSIFRYTTTMTPSFDLLIPYWPRDIMPLFKKNGRVQNTRGSIHATQIGTRSGHLFFSLEQPSSGSVFYFQNLTALNKYCIDTETSAGDLVGGEWPEIGMKLPVTTVDKPLKKSNDYIISDAFVVLSRDIPGNNYQVAEQFSNHLADVYVLLPKPETRYHNWPDVLRKGLKDLQEHKGCWKFADGRSYLNAYVSDYKSPPESMVQLAVLLPLLDFDKWSGEDHSPVIETLHNGLENFYDPVLKTIVRWLPALEKNLDWSEEQKQPEVMDSWYLHHPLLNLSRLALDGDELAKKLVLDSVDYVIKVAHHFKYQWPVFYKMATLEVLKKETQKGEGGEKDVPGAYAHLMIQVWQLTGDRKYFQEAVEAAKTLDGLGFDIFYQANNTSFAAGALLRLYKETGDILFLNLSNLCVAGILKNVQLWEGNYGNAQHYPTFFAVYPLNDAPYTAAYEEQEVLAGLHSYLREADDVAEVLPSIRLLLAECIRYIVNRVIYYYPPMLPPEIMAEKKDVKTGEVDPNLWIALEDLQDGWNRSGQVGQEVYGAGIAFGIVPRHYHKIDKAGFMVFTEYPVMGHSVRGNKLSFNCRGDGKLDFRMAIIPIGESRLPADIIVHSGRSKNAKKVHQEKQSKADYREYSIKGDSHVIVEWQ